VKEEIKKDRGTPPSFVVDQRIQHIFPLMDELTFPSAKTGVMVVGWKSPITPGNFIQFGPPIVGFINEGDRIYALVDWDSVRRAISSTAKWDEIGGNFANGAISAAFVYAFRETLIYRPCLSVRRFI
jgi:hypothetical protein